jgi:hypothetical protein
MVALAPLIAFYEGEIQEELHKRGFGDTIFDAIGSRVKGSALREGTARFETFLEVIGTRIKMERSTAQLKFHKMISEECLPLFYREVWEESRDQVLARHRSSDYSPYLFARWPRREGKTFAVSSAIAAVVLSVPSLVVATFSISQRVSVMMRDATLKWIVAAGCNSWIAKRTEEQVILSPSGQLDDPAATRLWFLPNSEKSRGIGADWIVLEEAEHISSSLYYNLVGPLLSLRMVVVTAISSPEGSTYNFMETLAATKRPDGKPMWKTFFIERLCDACKASNAIECPHKLEETPFWKSREREEEQRLMYGANQAQYRREILGIGENDDILAFSKIFLDAWEHRPPLTFDPFHGPAFCFTYIDPSGGGTQSDTAWITLAFDSLDRLVVSGVSRGVGEGRRPSRNDSSDSNRASASPT